jgi:hypothetical protein
MSASDGSKENPAPVGKANRRSRIWIDGGFQARYLALIAGVAAAVFLVLGVLYAEVLVEQRQLIGINAIAAGETAIEDAEFDSGLEAMVKSDDSVRFGALFVSALALVGLLSYVAVRITFRAVGPVRAASMMLNGLAVGDDRRVRSFRKGDEFQALAQDIIVLRDSMKDRAAISSDLLATAAAQIRADGANPELASRIDEYIATEGNLFGRCKQEG